jgi:two-component system response regulator RegX3
VRVLLVGQDRSSVDRIAESLGRFGHQVRHADTGRQALSSVHDADFVLLDLGLPDLDGREVCRRIRRHSTVPVIVVTHGGDELDCVLLLESGADDYLVKPCSMRELLARMDAVSRRVLVGAGHTASSHPAPRGDDDPRHERRQGALAVDLRARRALLHGRTVPLTRREFDLLAVLLAEPGAVVGRQQLIDEVWDENWHRSTRTLDVHVGSLRAKLGDRRWIESVRGVGFRVVEPCEP